MMSQMASSRKQGETSRQDAAENIYYYSANVPEVIREHMRQEVQRDLLNEEVDDVNSKLNEMFIFTSVDELLAAINKIRSARFRRFSSFDEAVKYAELPHAEANALISDSSNLPSEVWHSECRPPNVQEASHFRTVMEERDLARAMYLMWNNPYYLITRLDNPAIFKQSTRYHAMHGIAILNAPRFCSAILDLLRCIPFLRKLYPKDDLAMVKIKQKRLIDLFINMPDRTLNETPLHYACKFGSSSMVRVLLAQDECDREIKNTYGNTAYSIIGCRANDFPDALVVEAQNMFKGYVYLPVLRNPYNILNPIIGKMCSEAFMLKNIYGIPEAISGSDDGRVCTAFIGPLTFDTALLLHKDWQKKNYNMLYDNFSAELKDICLTDPHAGLERAARLVAVKQAFGFIGYIPELHIWCTFQSVGSEVDGLEVLEEFLYCINKMDALFLKYLDGEKKCKALLKFLRQNFFREIARKVKLSELKGYFSSFHLKHELFIQNFCQGILPYMYCLTSFSFSNVMERKKIHDEIGHILYMQLYKALKIEDLYIFVMRVNVKISSFSAVTSNWEHALCILKFVWRHHMLVQSEADEHECQCKWKVDEDFDFSSRSLHKRLVCFRQDLFNRIRLGEEIDERDPALEATFVPTDHEEDGSSLIEHNPETDEDDTKIVEDGKDIVSSEVMENRAGDENTSGFVPTDHAEDGSEKEDSLVLVGGAEAMPEYFNTLVGDATTESDANNVLDPDILDICDQFSNLSFDESTEDEESITPPLELSFDENTQHEEVITPPLQGQFMFDQGAEERNFPNPETPPEASNRLDEMLLFSGNRDVSSLDVDIYRAVENHSFDSRAFPLLTVWMEAVEKKLGKYCSSSAKVSRTSSLASEAIVRKLKKERMTT